MTVTDLANRVDVDADHGRKLAVDLGMTQRSVDFGLFVDRVVVHVVILVDLEVEAEETALRDRIQRRRDVEGGV